MLRRKSGSIPVMKNHQARFKSLGDDQPRGTFEALVSVYGNKDLHGDIVAAGAFDESIAAWKGRGPTPLVWSHQYDQIDSIIGEISDISTSSKGLKITGKFDLDQPKAARIHALMERGIITEFSWSGEVLEYEFLEEDEDDEDEWAWLFPGIKIKNVDLWEAGPCFKGANPETELLSIKNRGPLAEMKTIARALTAAKSGETLTPEHREALAEARNTITSVLASTEQSDDEDDTDDEDTDSDGDTAGDGDSESSKTQSSDPEGSEKIRALLELSAT